ncbi:MarR family winged helix-turn-helix transcriptional regulator [Jatrophihabitans fulvus]
MTQPETVRLDDQLCFALYAATNAITRSYRPLLREIGLTYSQYIALMVLWEQDGQPVHRIAERLQLPGNAVTPVLTRLEQAGFVARTSDPSDGRVALVRLTAAGRELERRAAAVQHEVRCGTGLDDDALEALRSRLHGLVDDMRTNADGEPATAAAE